MFARQRFTPVGFGPSFEEMLRGRPGGQRWLRRAAMSASAIVRHEFDSRHVQAFMLWMAFQTGQPVDSAGSGPLAYSIVFSRQRRSWTIPQGGSGELARALVEVIQGAGGEVLCEQTVVGLVLREGRCVGVETADGSRHLARKAVLSTIHVKDLVKMAPEAAWGEDFLYGVETYDEGVPAFATHYATTQPPQYPLPDGSELTAVSAGVAGWPEDIIGMGRDVKEGRLVRDGAWLLFATPTVADPSRAPEGRHTVKVLGMQPYDPGDGPGCWAQLREEIAAVHLAHLRRAAPNRVEQTILDELIVAPPDLELANPHMWHGTFHGGDRSLAQSGALRPAPGWAQHRMPIPGLYQTGGNTHPGGSVTGAPGRNAATVMLSDFGDDPGQAMSSGDRRAQTPPPRAPQRLNPTTTRPGRHDTSSRGVSQPLRGRARQPSRVRSGTRTRSARSCRRQVHLRVMPQSRNNARHRRVRQSMAAGVTLRGPATLRQRFPQRRSELFSCV